MYYIKTSIIAVCSVAKVIESLKHKCVVYTDHMVAISSTS